LKNMTDMELVRKGIAFGGIPIYIASRAIRRSCNFEKSRPRLDLAMSIFESYTGSLALAMGVREIIPEGFHPSIIGLVAAVMGASWANGVREAKYCKRINAGKFFYNFLGAVSSVFI